MYEQYIQEVMEAGVTPVGIRAEIEELVLTLLGDSILVDKVWFAVSGYPSKRLNAICYDEDGIEYEAVGTWEYDVEERGKPGSQYYELVDLTLEEVDD